ncbi:MAG: DUF1109 domain-containing protein [Xanthobacteraceae bacterium]|nr:DUF1109 domain-containing protein [Xanthobacteraceae bacterium]
MMTSNLVRTLTLDRQFSRKPSVYLARALVLGIVVVGILFFSEVGFRADIGAALHTTRFVVKFFVLVPLACLATIALFHVSAPVESKKSLLGALFIPVAGLLIAVAAELLITPESVWLTRMIGTNNTNCLSIIPTLAIFPLVGFLVALKQAAPRNPALCGALAGLAASSIAATFYASNCFDDSPLFVALWYPLAMGIVVLAGYLAGGKWLRW